MKIGLMLRLAKANVVGGGHTKSCGWRLGTTGLLRINSAKTTGAESEQKQAGGRVDGCAGIDLAGPCTTLAGLKDEFK